MTKHIILPVVLSVVSGTLASAAEPPNVVFFISDDLGWADPGYQGSEIRSPTIDRIAAKGVKLDRYYAFPVCSPTRTALMTGRSPLTLGIWGQVPNSGLPLDERMLPEAFHDAGYQTFMVGKWHLGKDHVQVFPHNRGFDHFYGHAGGTLDFYSHMLRGALDWQRNGKSIREEGYTTNLLAEEARQVLRERDEEKPFFLYVAFNAVHTPLQAPESAVDRYASIKDPHRRIYAGMLETMDSAMARILDQVESTGQTDNTLVVWVSDNGGPQITGSSNKPLRGHKGQSFEGGIRVPGAVHWPGTVEGGGTIRQQIFAYDWLPTLAAATGIEIGHHKSFDGQNVWPAIAEGKTIDRGLKVIGTNGNYAVFRDQWKLVQTPGRDGVVRMLFDILADPNESRDLAAKNPDLTAELAAALSAYPSGDGRGARRARDQMERFNEETLPPVAEAAARD